MCRKKYSFHQTGANFIKDKKTYKIKRQYQLEQARKANIDYRIGKDFIPETAAYQTEKEIYKELTLFDNKEE